MLNITTEWPCLKDFIKDKRKLVIFTVLLTAVCWAQNAFSSNIRIDGEYFINNPGTVQGWHLIGRFGMLPVKFILGNLSFNPYFSGALFIILFSCASILFLYLIYVLKPDVRYLWFFAGMFVSCNTWAYMFYFTMMQAEIAFALLILASSLIVFTTHPISGEAGSETLRVICVVLMVVAFGCYQAVIPVFVTGAAICILLWLDSELKSGREPDFRAYIVRSLNYVVPFAAAYAIYSIVARVWFSSGNYLTGMSLWKTNSASVCLAMILARMVQCLGGNPEMYSFAFLFGCILCLCIFIYDIYGKRLKSCLPMYELTWAVLIVSPFIVLIRLGGNMVPRMQFSLQFVSAFICMYVLNRVSRKNLRGIIAVCSIFVMFYQFSILERLYYTDDIREKQDEALAFEIASDIELYSEKTSFPVVFVGRKDANLNKACLKSDVFGASLFSWDYNDIVPSSGSGRCTGMIEAVTGTKYTEPTDEQLLLACIYAAEMPSYPHEGYIAEKEGILVIKLSD